MSSSSDILEVNDVPKPAPEQFDLTVDDPQTDPAAPETSDGAANAAMVWVLRRQWDHAKALSLDARGARYLAIFEHMQLLWGLLRDLSPSDAQSVLGLQSDSSEESRSESP
jgi:hypothetical protein